MLFFSDGTDRDRERPQDGAVVGTLVVRGDAPEALREPYVHRSLQRITEGRYGIAGIREERGRHRDYRIAGGSEQVWTADAACSIPHGADVPAEHTVRAIGSGWMRIAACAASTFPLAALSVLAARL
jgi:hypothetical protein